MHTIITAADEGGLTLDDLRALVAAAELLPASTPVLTTEVTQWENGWLGYGTIVSLTLDTKPPRREA